MEGATDEEEDWVPTDRAPVEVDIDMSSAKTVEETGDAQAMLKLGFSNKQLKRLASCFAVVKTKCLRTLLSGAIGCILEKQGDMQRAAGAAEKVSNWLQEVDDEVAGEEGMQAAREGEAMEKLANLEKSAKTTAGEAKKVLLEKANLMEGHLDNIRAFHKEAGGTRRSSTSTRPWPTTATSSTQTQPSRSTCTTSATPTRPGTTQEAAGA